MNQPFIVDAHLHTGSPGIFFSPETNWKSLSVFMDRLSIQYGICTDLTSIEEGSAGGIEGLQKIYEETGGRLHYLGVYHPRYSSACLGATKKAVRYSGFVGLKIHPVAHGTAGDDPSYEPVWQFAAEHDLAILAHSWSPSEYHPEQALATPRRFEKYVERFATVRLVLAHTGGRGSGRGEMVRLANRYPNVFTDFAGDIFDEGLIESLVKVIGAERVLFGSDFPWLDPRANLTRVFLSEISTESKRKILRDNAIRIFKLDKYTYQGRHGREDAAMPPGFNDMVDNLEKHHHVND